MNRAVKNFVSYLRRNYRIHNQLPQHRRKRRFKQSGYHRPTTQRTDLC